MTDRTPQIEYIQTTSALPFNYRKGISLVPRGLSTTLEGGIRNKSFFLLHCLPFREITTERRGVVTSFG